MKHDQINTPLQLAMRMVDLTRDMDSSASIIADFAVGTGELLSAAQRRWPTARIVGVDVDPDVIFDLGVSHPSWCVSVSDFLDDKSQTFGSVLYFLKGQVSRILLNPPFSCRGSKGVHVVIDGRPIRASIALAFVLRSVEFLNETGEIVAVLPAGSLNGERDMEAFEVLRSLGDVEVVQFNEYNLFSDYHVRTALVRFRRMQSAERECCREQRSILPQETNAIGSVIRIVRGSIPVHVTAGGKSDNGFPMLHSTELRPGPINFARRSTTRSGRVVTGPLVLLPRVGRPGIEKVTVYLGELKFAISDCVFALLCDTGSQAEKLLRDMIEHWDNLRSLYYGTCALYLTVAHLRNFLQALGYRTELVRSIALES